MSESSLDELARLEGERRFLLGSLADLEREHAAGDVDDHDYTTLHDGYTARAASVLRAIELGHVTQPRKPRRIPWRVLSLVVALVVGGTGLGALVARSSGTRIPGQTATGGISASVQSLLVEARSLQGTDLLGAIKRYDQVLKIDPENQEALTYRGWFLVLSGLQGDQSTLISAGRKNLDEAIAVAPKYPDALAFQGVVAMRVDNDPAKAEGFFDRLFATEDLSPLVRQLVGPVDTAAREALGRPARPVPSATTVG